MTVWRWDHDPAMAELGWTPPIYIRKRKFRSRNRIEDFKQRALQQALKERGTVGGGRSE